MPRDIICNSYYNNSIMGTSIHTNFAEKMWFVNLETKERGYVPTTRVVSYDTKRSNEIMEYEYSDCVFDFDTAIPGPVNQSKEVTNE